MRPHRHRAQRRAAPRRGRTVPGGRAGVRPRTAPVRRADRVVPGDQAPAGRHVRADEPRRERHLCCRRGGGGCRTDTTHRAAAATAKLLAADAAQANAGAAVQVLGGMGFTWAMLPHYLVKRAWVLDQAFGTAEELAGALGARRGGGMTDAHGACRRRRRRPHHHDRPPGPAERPRSTRRPPDRRRPRGGVHRRLPAGGAAHRGRHRLLLRCRLGREQPWRGQAPARQPAAADGPAGPSPDRPAHRDPAARGVRGARLGGRPRVPARPGGRPHRRRRRQPVLAALHHAGVHPGQRRDLARPAAGRRSPGRRSCSSWADRSPGPTRRRGG